MTEEKFDELIAILETEWALKEALAVNWWEGVKLGHELLADKHSNRTD